MALDYSMLPPMETVRLLSSSGRLHWALARLSRDKFLYPNEVRKIGIALARCLSPARPGQILSDAINHAWQGVGLLQGLPPFFIGDPKYGQMLELVERKPKNIELEILKLTLKGL